MLLTTVLLAADAGETTAFAEQPWVIGLVTLGLLLALLVGVLVFGKGRPHS
jgi:hypothetical protein